MAEQGAEDGDLPFLDFPSGSGSGDLAVLRSLLEDVSAAEELGRAPEDFTPPSPHHHHAVVRPSDQLAASSYRFSPVPANRAEFTAENNTSLLSGGGLRQVCVFLHSSLHTRAG